MRTDFIILVLNNFMDVCEIQDPVFVETFIPELAVETLDERVIHGFSRLDTIGLQPVAFPDEPVNEQRMSQSEF